MNARDLVALALWLFGSDARPEQVGAMVVRWQSNPGAAERWADVRAREQARAGKAVAA